MHRFPARPRHHRPGHTRRGLPGGDRRRGALRRSRPFRPKADPGRLALLVLPALLLNYFGQGALVLRTRGDREPVLSCCIPNGLLLPMVALATAATVIASQAVITGAYSMTRQAIQLGLLPRMEGPAHLGGPGRTDLHAAGQHAAADRRALAGVAVPLVERLAAAYGIAVATTMVVAGILGFIVIWKLWKWRLWHGGAADRAASSSIDHDVLRRQSPEDVRRRLGAAAARHRHSARHRAPGAAARACSLDKTRAHRGAARRPDATVSRRGRRVG